MLLCIPVAVPLQALGGTYTAAVALVLAAFVPRLRPAAEPTPAG